MADPPAVVEARAITRVFGSTRTSTVLDGISFALAAGEFCALIGPSGSGKSTLLNIIGLLDRPTRGEVLLCGQPMTPLGDDARTHARSRTLGFVFQFHHLLSSLTALENVMLPAWGDRGRIDLALRERAAQLLGEVGLLDRAHRRITDLSGGEAQRVAVARALCLNPPLVLADEPTGNLDTQNADSVFALLRRINRQHRTAFIVVTHDDRLAARCDRILQLVDGRMVTDQTRGPTPEGRFAALPADDV
ncbi:MAG: ABC transporter ATP-binding protein [Myxococcales bacterium]|nr:ABC transporter ATP-binding protein [Myxococcales bacterium]